MSSAYRARFFSMLAITVLASAASSGCEGRAPINQVQPGAIRRTVFEGEWYMQQTVIDSPYSAGYTFVGEQGDLERIVWEIQEDLLVARRGYEFIAGSEPDGIAGTGGATEHGAAIAMYRIERQFDIRRAYNPTTGEELNVIVENDTDRPWYERDYIRVDWSENLINDAGFLSIQRYFDGIESEPVAYHIEDPAHPHAPRFETRDAQGNWVSMSAEHPADAPVYYMDIVNKLFIRPTTVDIPGLGPLPSCYLLYQDHLDCAPGEITVRNSFLRVDSEDTDYQPSVYTGDRMERFGYFVTERAGYDSHYGVVEPARFRFANRHNLWMTSHRRDNDELVRCTDEAACSTVPGSHCDLDWARAQRAIDPATGQLSGACTIPFRDREVRPIVYYTSPNFPDDLFPDAQHLADEWNRAFVETVSSMREIECRDAGGDPTTCATERDRPDHQHMFVLCHSPVRDVDSTDCGPVGTTARAGDLRYSMIGWVNDAHLSSPLGYGPSSADPLTGEIIMGNAFVYGAAMETLTSFARDIIAILDGDLTPDSITSGANVEAWVRRMQSPGSEETGRPADDHAIRVDGEDAAMFDEAMDFSWAHDASDAHAAPPTSPAELFERMGEAEDRLWASGSFGHGDDEAEARLQNLFDTDIERMMTNADMRMAAGLDPNLPVSGDVLDAASPLRGMSLANQHAVQRVRERMLGDNCVLNAEFADDGLFGLAQAIQRAASSGDGTMQWYGESYALRGADGNIDYGLVRSMLRHPIFEAVTAHEVGHTIGLRHNFSGSYDALNYLPHYWELRDDGNMEPRAWDPMTQAEIDGRILEYQYSTVMDYGANFVVTDANGIGHYDVAAVKMGYGDLVEVFSSAANPDEAVWWNFIQGAGWPVPLRLESFTATGEPSAYMYTEWPDVLGGIESIQARSDVRYTSLRPDTFLRSQGIDDLLVDGNGRPAVPYMFCSDEQADLNPDCLRYDQGADAYESIQTVIDSYWNYYIFTNFRRQRLGFRSDTVATRVHDRYFEKIQRANQIYSLYRSVFDDIFGGAPGYDRFWTRRDGMGAWTVAVGAGFQLLTQVVTAPEPGSYGEEVRGDGTRALIRGGAGAGPDVSAFDGRFMETTWNFDAGYFWFDQLDRVGYFYDKVAALEILVDPTTYFLGRDTDTDIRRYQINFASSFGPAVTAFMQGVLAEDWETVGPRAVGAELVYPNPLQLEQASMTGVPLDPSASFSIQLYGAVYGMAYIPQTYDQSFLNRSRIFVRGGAEEVTLAPGTPTVELTDTASGLTYVAVRYPDPGDAHETGVGASMLDHARALQTRGATTELRRYIDNIDVVRRLSWRLGFGAQP